MGKCREALSEEDGDVEKAVEWLKRRGVKSMEKRATDSAEALLGLSVDSSGASAGLVELRCETDFVTRSDDFQSFCLQLSKVLEDRPIASAEGLLSEPLAASARVAEGTEVKDALLHVGSVLGEKLVLGECWRLSAPEDGVVAGYVHPKFADGQPNTGRMGALVSVKALGGKADAQGLKAVANQLARHIVAGQPRFISIESVPADVLNKEKETMKAAHLEQMGSKAGKMDDKVMEKVLAGKTQKWYVETVLLCQELISAQGAADAKPPPVSDWLKTKAKEMGVDQLVVEDFKLATL